MRNRVRPGDGGAIVSRKEAATVIVGGSPRADLLPPSVREAIRRRPIVRRLVALVALVALVTAVGVAGATYLALNAQQALADEQRRSEDLLAQQLQFADARAVNNALNNAVTAREAATSAEVDWEALLDEIRASLPAGLVLVSVDGATRVAPAEDEPLRQDSIGSFRINANSPTVPDVESWLIDLEGVTGYAGIAPPITVSGSEGASYSVTIEVLLDTSAYLGRFSSSADSDNEGEE